MERIYVEIGNLCNLHCSFCPSTTRPPRQMTPEELRRVSGQVSRHARYVYLHVMGEPLLHPHLEEALRIFHEDGLRICVTTNGTLLARRGSILLGCDGLHKVSISLHAPEANEGGASLDQYLRQCVSFAEEAAARGIFTVLRLWNLDSPEGKGANAENGRIHEALREAFPLPWTPRRGGFRLADRIFLEYDGLFTWPSESRAAEQEEGTCHGLRDQVAVLADGTVVPCCLDSEGRIPLGNLLEQELEEILESPRAAAMREGFRQHRLVEPLCRSCTFARRFG